jgi:hypothetical protein
VFVPEAVLVPRSFLSVQHKRIARFPPGFHSAIERDSALEVTEFYSQSRRARSPISLTEPTGIVSLESHCEATRTSTPN